MTREKLKICEKSHEMSLKVACYLYPIPWDHVGTAMDGFSAAVCLNQSLAAANHDSVRALLNLLKALF